MKIFISIFVLMNLSTNLVFAENYGAITFDMKTNGYGTSWDESTQAAADQKAMQQCLAVSEGCQFVGRFFGNCGAFATGKNQVWGFGYGASRQIAEKAAISYCNQQAAGAGCRVRVWGCNSKANVRQPRVPMKAK